MADFLKTITNSVKHWYILLIIGILLIALGIYVFFVPLDTYLTLTILFTTSFIAMGLLGIIFAVQNRKGLEGWGWYLTSGILNLLVGLFLAAYPAISIATLPYVVGFTLLFNSFQGLGFAFDLKNYGVLSWGNVAIASVLGILFSIVLVANPLVTSMSLVTLTGLALIFAGISAISVSFGIKKLKDYPEKLSADLKSRFAKLKEEYSQQVAKK